MLLGIGLIGSVTSTVTAFFVEEKNDSQNDKLEQELSDLKQELRLLREEIGKGR